MDIVNNILGEDKEELRCGCIYDNIAQDYIKVCKKHREQHKDAYERWDKG